jgi:hypothetical protein
MESSREPEVGQTVTSSEVNIKETDGLTGLV